MINSIRLSGFQSHKDSHLNFCNGVNVIIGNSDQGKSSIVRAFTWAFKNRPTGDGFINFDLPKNEVCSVGVEFDNDDFILREKNKKVNSYSVYSADEDEEKELKALRSDVPEEVQNISKIKDVNLQSQQDPYFLLNDSAGVVAKAFNEVAGLSVMDSVLQNVNALVRKSTGNIKVKDAEILRLQSKIKELLWVDEAEQIFTDLEKQDSILYEKEQEIKELEDVLEELDKLNDELYKCKDIKKAILSMEELQERGDKVSETKQRITSLFKLISTFKFSDSALNKYIDIKQIQTAFKGLKNDSETISNIVDEISELEKSIYLLQKIEKDTEQAKKEYVKYTNDFSQELKRLGKCPTCGGKI